MKNISATYFLFGSAIAVVIGLIGFSVLRNTGPSKYDSFAQCLTDNGAKFYGAWWCPHCKNQKALFGTAISKVNYIECSNQNKDMSQECRDAGVEGYPTWIFADGSKISGEQTFQTLAGRTGCELPSEDK